MTCVLGLVHDGKVFMAGDSAAIDAESMAITVSAGRKVFHRMHTRHYSLVLGYSGSFRAGEVLKHAVEVPAYGRTSDIERYIVTKFVPAVRAAFVDATIEDAANSTYPFLVGISGRLFAVDSDYHAMESLRGFAAVGQGAPWAEAVLAVTRGDPERRLRRALGVAEEFCAGVRGPFDVVSA